MSNIRVEIDGLENLDKMINYVSSISNANTDSKLNNFIKSKVIDTYKEIMDRELVGGTTNDDQIELYKKSWDTYDLKDGSGFVLYNDAKIPADYYNTRNFNTSGYPDGQFSIAMAFEYGTGIVGIGTGNPNAWEYNQVDKSNSRSHKLFQENWYLPKNAQNGHKSAHGGYQGFEIFRKTVEEVNRNLDSWVKEFYEKEGVLK